MGQFRIGLITTKTTAAVYKRHDRNRIVTGVILLWIGCLFIFGQNESTAGPRFVDNGDGTITDHQLGLMWTQKDNQNDVDWNQAHAWVRSLPGSSTGKQYSNWRMPTIEELQSLYIASPTYAGYRTQCGFAVKIVSDIKISCVLIWASDTALGAHVAFNFNIGNPFTVPSYDVKGCRALAVRNLD